MKHLEEVNETYFVHMLYALKLAFILLFLSLISLVHAVLPQLCSRFVSSYVIKRLYPELKKRSNYE